MYEQDRLDKRSLVTQLHNYKIILEMNMELFGKDLLLKDHIRLKVDMLGSYVNELSSGEIRKDPK